MTDTNTKTLIIIDDDLEIAEMYATKFRLEGFNVFIYNNGLSALGELVSVRPDAILLDIMMPGMNGFEVLLTIKKLAQTIKSKIIMFSNSSAKENIEKGQELGADLYLIKAETTPKIAVNEVNKILSTKNDNTAKIQKIGDKQFIKCPCCKEIIFIED